MITTKTMIETLDKAYWEAKYAAHKTGWDIGYVSDPLKAYIDQLTTKNLRILVPGAGNGYEVLYLLEKGFTDITVIDIAKQPLQNLEGKIKNSPHVRLLEENYFHHQGTYDLQLEQTFFCALHPTLRTKYVSKSLELLASKGKIAGVFFDFELTDQGPPFGGSKQEYIKLFNQHFTIHTLERCYNSIKPRAGRELFSIFKKK